MSVAVVLSGGWVVSSSLIMGLGSVSYPWSATSTTGSSFVYLIHWVCRTYPLGSRILVSK